MGIRVEPTSLGEMRITGDACVALNTRPAHSQRLRNENLLPVSLLLKVSGQFRELRTAELQKLRDFINHKETSTPRFKSLS